MLAAFIKMLLDDIKHALESLGSVIPILTSSDEAQRIFHTPFTGLIVNKELCDDECFLIDVPAQAIS